LSLEAPLLGDQLGGDALRHDVVTLRETRRQRSVAGATGVRAHRHARHVLDATGDDDVVLAGHDALCREVGGLLAGAAHPIERGPAHIEGQAGDQRGIARNVEALLAELVDAAKNDVLHLGRVHADAADEITQDQRREVVGANGRELPVLFADGGANGSDDDSVSHESSSEVGFSIVPRRHATCIPPVDNLTPTTRSPGGAKCRTSARNYSENTTTSWPGSASSTPSPATAALETIATPSATSAIMCGTIPAARCSSSPASD